MRRSLMVVAALTAPILASAVLSATANSAVLEATANSAVQASLASDAAVKSVSCARDGDCAAGGQYVDASGNHALAFVLTERNGQWGAGIEVPGLAALSPRSATINSVSCTLGGCAAGGTYQGPAGRRHAFVTNEKNGRWSRLVTVFSARTAPSALAAVGSVSCSGPANCAAGGGMPAFVVSEVNGRWGRAHQFGATGQNSRAEVSCTSAGNCSASWKAFVARERNGRWGKPMAVPGLSALGTRDGITSLSCTAAANCAVGGTYDSRHGLEVFVASERNGRWVRAIEIPGFTALNQEGYGLLASVSCVSAGNCVAGGTYAQPADFAGGVYEPFVASERNGRWGKAIEVPGIPPAGSTLCEPDSASCVAGQVSSVSCAPGGTCAVGGWFDTPAISGTVAFVATYKNGHWANATQVPGLAALDTAKNSAVRSVSCTLTGKCAGGGSYSNLGGQLPAFVVDENNGTWGQAQTVRVQS
jgi:hypothetical protein